MPRQRPRLAAVVTTAAAAAVVTAAAAFAGATLAAPAGATGGPGPRPGDLAFRGEAKLPAGMTFEGTVVGGLSSMAYDAQRDVYYAISDDQGAGFTPTSTPARFYTLRVDTADGSLDAGDVTVLDVTTFTGTDGLPLPALSLDPEGLTLTRDDTLVVTSEGIPARGIAPFVREFGLDGRQVAELPVPDAFTPSTGHGVRPNLGFEAAAVAPNGQTLFVGAENALVQDGPAASLTTGSPARLLRYHLGADGQARLDRQYVYETGPVVAPSPVFTVNGLVEVLPLNNSFLLAMERSFSVGAGNTIRLYRVGLAGATDVSGAESISDVQPLHTATKSLLMDLGDLGLTLDNLEGMTLGPRLPDGSRSLVLVSDNNFTPGQVSQFLLFALR
jgi:hypothetical protein